MGWNSRNVELYTTLLLNLLGAGRSGDLELKKKGVLVKPPWFSDKVDWRKFIAPSKAAFDDNVDIIKGIFSFYNLDIKVHNDHPVAGEIEEEDDEEEGEEEEIAEGAALAPLLEEQLVRGVIEQENVEEEEEEGTDLDEESTEAEDLAPDEEEVLELNLSISDDDLGGETSLVPVEVAQQDGDLELPDPEARVNVEQERAVNKSNCVGQAKKQKRALSLRKRTPSKRVRKVPPKLLD